jgi:hypothetical protein
VGWATGTAGSITASPSWCRPTTGAGTLTGWSGRARPAVFDLQPSKLAELLVADGVVDDISHERLRVLLREEGVTFNA